MSVNIVYHEKCFDGEAGLWVFKKYYDEKQLNIIGKNSGFLDLNIDSMIKDSQIYFVDICPKLDVLIKCFDYFSKVVILDHHKTNKELLESVSHDKLFTIFDMDRSGCQISWDFLFPDNKYPPFLNYVADRDLWTWKLENSEEINEGIGFYGIEHYDKYYEHWDIWENSLLSIGKLLMKKKIDSINDIIKNNSYFKTYAGKDIMISFCTDKSLVSKLGNEMCNQNPHISFSVIVSGCNLDTNEYYVSVRSNGYDVSKVAKRFGGGGHQRAAGFTINVSDFNIIFVKQNTWLEYLRKIFYL